MNDPQEALIRREYANSTGQCITLHEALTDMLAQQLNGTTTSSVRKLIPLEIPPSMVEYRIELVANELIRRKYPHRVRIVYKYFVEKLADSLH